MQCKMLYTLARPKKIQTKRFKDSKMIYLPYE